MCTQNLKFAALPVPEIIGGSRKMGSPWIRPRSLFSKIFNGLLFGWTLWMYWPNLKSVAFPIPEIIGGTRKNGQSLDTPTLPFFQNFSWAFVRMDRLNILGKFEVRSFTHSWEWDNSDWIFWVGCEPQPWRRGGRTRSGIVPLERALVSSYRLPIVTFSLSVRVSEILPLLCSRAPFFPPHL